jgi:two-component system sensor histidine kinase/response regulator
VQLNQATARELGLTDPAGAIGKSDVDFFPASLAEEYQADERRLFATGEPMLSKLERQSGTGAERWVLATKAPLRDARGEIIGLVGVNRDVTERLQTEEARARLAAIVEGAEDAITSRTLDGIITSWNRGAERLYGYTAEEVIGRSFAMLMPEDERPPSPALVTAFGAPTTQFETRRRRKDGTMVDVSVAMSPIRDDRGETIGVSTITRDITERKRFEQELQEALEAAQAATRTKSLFLAMMSHELRTPLQAVLGYADLLLLGPEASLTPEQREDLSYIHSGASRMVELIEHLLDLSRMEAGRLELAAEPVDLAEIIEQVRQDVAPQAAAKALAVQIDAPASLPPALGDPDRLRQILLNLAGNAVKFTEQGTVCIRAREAGDGISLAVIDTGIGISPEALPYIFEEFRQVDGSLTRRYGGAGLGLAIARRLAEQMGGNLTVVSTPGSGSTFTLRMPAAR